MKKFVIIVLDGFGIGAMADAKIKRPGDEKANTLGSILKECPELSLPMLEKLGLMNAYGTQSGRMHFSACAAAGKAQLMHYGADTFMGHQELMGSIPPLPVLEPFSMKAEEIRACLLENGHKVQRMEKDGLHYLLADGCSVIADTIDADAGVAYSCVAALNEMPFEKQLEIGRLVRKTACVGRVIVLGGAGNNLASILSAVHTRDGRVVGVGTVQAGCYGKGYRCVNFGCKMNQQQQIPAILTSAGIRAVLIGKAADIIANDGGENYPCVSAQQAFQLTEKAIQSPGAAMICTNIQETDVAGHSCDARRYAQQLRMADEKIGRIMQLLDEEDLLVVTADHGNDPAIGHSRHTRENVPVLVYQKGGSGAQLGVRKTLSDIGATACDFFHTRFPENGKSFLPLLKNSNKRL